MTPPIIAVLGTPKSGISILGQCLWMLGLTSMDDQAQVDISTIHGLLFQDLGYSPSMAGPLPQDWMQTPSTERARQRIGALLTNCRNETGLWFIADQFLCRFLPLWNEAFQEADLAHRFVLMVRHPWEAAPSLARVENIDLAKAHLLWLAHVRDALRSCKDQGHVLITFDQLLADPVSALARIGPELDLTWPNDPWSVSSSLLDFVQPNLKRHHASNLPDKDKQKFQAYERLYQEIRRGQWSGGIMSAQASADAGHELIDSLLDVVGKYEKQSANRHAQIERIASKSEPSLFARVVFPSTREGGKIVETISLIADEWQHLTLPVPEPTLLRDKPVILKPLNTDGTVEISAIKLTDKVTGKTLSSFTRPWELVPLELQGSIVMLPNWDNLILLITGVDCCISIPVSSNYWNSPVEFSIWIKASKKQKIIEKYKNQIQPIELFTAINQIQVNIRDKVKYILNPQKICDIVKPNNKYDKVIFETIRLQSILSLINQKPRPSLNNLDEKLSKYLNYENGYFVELGANNGYSQSNTFFLEYFKNWKGILIEGIEELSWLCNFLRLNSKVVHAACVDFLYPYDTITMRYANLMSIIKGAFKNEEADNQHIIKGMEFQNIKKSYEVEVPARTLTSILKEHNVNKIDFLSLDVEGYEANVLRGLDFEIFQPKFICVEARFFEEVNNLLKNNYFIVEQLSHHDYLFKNRNFR